MRCFWLPSFVASFCNFYSLKGRFCVYLFDERKVLYGGVKNLGRTLEIDDIEYDIVTPNYAGSSKGMEASALEDFLDWASKNGTICRIFSI